MLVVDTPLAVATVRAGRTAPDLGDDDLRAPPLLWSEARSVLHEAAWRHELAATAAAEAADRLERLAVAPAAPGGLGREAWRLADELGLARTYDAEFLALARLLGCRLVTLDARLRRGADRLGFVVTPLEL